MNKRYNIYFRDLLPDIQEELLDFYGLENAEDTNWEITPLAVVELQTQNP